MSEGSREDQGGNGRADVVGREKIKPSQARGTRRQRGRLLLEMQKGVDCRTLRWISDDNALWSNGEAGNLRTIETKIPEATWMRQDGVLGQ